MSGGVGAGTGGDLTVQLKPQQIRTFILTVDNEYHNEDKCTYNWLKTYPREIPTGAYEAGYDETGTPLYICRHELKGVVIAGKADNQSTCVVTDGGREVYTEGQFEVLAAHNTQWVNRHGEDPIPPGALIAGSTGTPNTTTYIGRCDSGKSGKIVGKIDYKFYYGFHGLERNDCLNHEILVCN